MNPILSVPHLFFGGTGNRIVESFVRHKREYTVYVRACAMTHRKYYLDLGFKIKFSVLKNIFSPNTRWYA